MPDSARAPTAPSSVELELNGSVINILLPPSWVLVDLDSDGWLDSVADRFVVEFVEWSRSNDVRANPDETAMLDLVTTVQADVLSSFRDLTEDLPADALACGIDLVGDDGEALISSWTVTVIAEFIPDAGAEGPVELMTTPEGLAARGVEMSDLPDFAARSMWCVDVPALAASVVMQGQALGSGAEMLAEVWRWIASTVRVTEREASHA